MNNIPQHPTTLRHIRTKIQHLIETGKINENPTQPTNTSTQQITNQDNALDNEDMELETALQRDQTDEYEPHNIRIGTLNTRSLQGKIEIIENIMQRRCIDIMILTECNLGLYTGIDSQWLVACTRNENNPKYTVAVMAKPELHAYIAQKNHDPEGKWITIEMGEWSISGIYLNPAMSNIEAQAKLEELLKTTKKNPQLKTIITGDFNARFGSLVGDHRSNERQYFINILTQHDMSPVIPQGHKYTFEEHAHQALTPLGLRTTRTKRSIVDYIFISSDLSDKIMNTTVLFEEDTGSDHHAIVTTIQISSPLPTQQPITFKRIDTYKITKLINTIKHQKKVSPCGPISREELIAEQYGLKLIQNVTDIQNKTHDYERYRHDPFEIRTNKLDELEEEIRNTIYDTTVEVFGLKECRKKPKPYFNCQELKEAIHRRNIWYRRRRNARNEATRNEAHEQYTTTLKQISRLCRKLKRKAYKEYLEKIDNAPVNAKLKMLRCLKNRKMQDASSTPLASDITSMNIYATFFENSFSNKFEPPNNTCDPTHYDHLTNDFDRGLHLVQKQLISAAIARLAWAKATGPDKLPNEIFSISPKHISELLQPLFQLTIKYGCTPSSWRHIHIVPIWKKKGSPKDISNYRPISLANSIRKIFELTLLDELVNHIEPLSIEQNGFRKRRGCPDAAATMDYLISKQRRVSHKHPLHLCLLDISKAYDSVPHRHLFYRLQQKHLPGWLIRILAGLFTNCSSNIVIKGTTSRRIQHTAGLLQGSTLSPILYSAFIDNLSTQLRAQGPTLSLGQIRINHILYADDAILFSDSPIKLQQLITTASTHSIQNFYRYNVTKCEYIKPPPSEEDYPQENQQLLTIYNEAIPEKTHVQYLGITFTHKGYSAPDHISILSNRFLKSLYFFKHFGLHTKGLSFKSKISLYKSFIRPTCEYGISIGVLHKSSERKLDSLQLAALSSMFSVNKKTSLDAMLLLSYLPSMKQRHERLAAAFMHRIQFAPPNHILHQVKLDSSSSTFNNSIKHQQKHNTHWLEFQRQLTTAYLTQDIEKIRELKKHFPTSISKTIIHQDLQKKSTSSPSFYAQQIYIPVINNNNYNHRLLPKMSPILEKVGISNLTHRLRILWCLGKLGSRINICKKCNKYPADQQHMNACMAWTQKLNMEAEVDVRVAGGMNTALYLYARDLSEDLLENIDLELALAWKTCRGFPAKIHGIDIVEFYQLVKN